MVYQITFWSPIPEIASANLVRRYMYNEIMQLTTSFYTYQNTINIKSDKLQITNHTAQIWSGFMHNRMSVNVTVYMPSGIPQSLHHYTISNPQIKDLSHHYGYQEFV